MFKLGGIEFWPILGKVNFCSDLYELFIIAAYSGKNKPSLLNGYFSKFVAELNLLLERFGDNYHIVDKKNLTSLRSESASSIL